MATQISDDTPISPTENSNEPEVENEDNDEEIEK